METFPSMTGSTFQELKLKYPEFKGEADEFVEFLRDRSTVSFTEFFKKLERPFKFYKLLRYGTKFHFNTMENRKRYYRVWGKLEDLHNKTESKTPAEFRIEKTLEIIKRAAKLARYDWFIELNNISTAAYVPVELGHLTDEEYFSAIESGVIQFRDEPFHRHILYNAPDLKIRIGSSLPKSEDSSDLGNSTKLIEYD